MQSKKCSISHKYHITTVLCIIQQQHKTKLILYSLHNCTGCINSTIIQSLISFEPLEKVQRTLCNKYYMGNVISDFQVNVQTSSTGAINADLFTFTKENLNQKLQFLGILPKLEFYIYICIFTPSRIISCDQLIIVDVFSNQILCFRPKKRSLSGEVIRTLSNTYNVAF